jgi:hypothetical protein
MKMRRTMLFSLCLTVGLLSTGIAFAQTPAPTPTPLTTQSAIVVILALIVGYIGQAVNTGNLFGIVTTPKAWIPYLTLLGSFLAAFGTSVQGDSTLNGTAWFNAVIAGFAALMAAAGGSAAHTHLNSHKTTALATAAKAALAAPPPPPPAKA